jgi:hypothetical protein
MTNELGLQMTMSALVVQEPLTAVAMRLSNISTAESYLGTVEIKNQITE